ncbi:MAG: DUF4258 domain-containing protein [candidate division NC10 bacterium]|nr:DUF4258 domain-containing protein [candidate division NC10 bacterium]MBI2454537.1 DUF4258 domain-containing protein [candidate division NC10 bacterium]MBI3085493.1 DUF4258 domain-containing protein [candidate division NC10 bacterium]
MDEEAGMLALVRQAARKKMLFLPHAVRQMARPERMITPTEVREAIERGTVIEDYPGDPRGHSCLVLGYGDAERAIHVVCAPKEDYLAIITAYLPDKNEWTDDLRARRRP